MTHTELQFDEVITMETIGDYTDALGYAKRLFLINSIAPRGRVLETLGGAPSEYLKNTRYVPIAG